MTATVNDFNIFDQGETTGTLPANLGQFEFPDKMAALLKVEVFAVRSDMAARAWTLESLIKRNGAGPLVQQNLPSPPNAFASAADATALTGVTIAMFTDGTFVGVACTGQAGQNIEWSVKITGRGIVQS